MSTSTVVRSEREEPFTFADLPLVDTMDERVALSLQGVFSNRIFTWLLVNNQNSGTRRYTSSHSSGMTARSTVLWDSPLREV